MYVIVFKSKYFQGYLSNGTPSFTTKLKDSWQFLSEKYANEEAELAKLKNYTIKKI